MAVAWEYLLIQVLIEPPSLGARRVVVMGNRSEIRDFLTSRRAKISSEQAGLPVYGGNRRVAGLRREEVAMLAGVSVDYYTRLERGNPADVSESVLDALAHALRLDEAELTHLFDLARAANTTVTTVRTRRRPTSQHVRPAVQRILDAMSTASAYVRNGHLDILAANQLGHVVFAPLFADSVRSANIAQVIFLDPRCPGLLRRVGRAGRRHGHAAARRPAATRTTGRCPTSSGSCRPAAGSSTCTIQSSAT
jgi:transcriptional regulator with XRE-family HTH domain